MNTFKWLLKREFWEHKGAFFWAPVVVGAIITAIVTATFLVPLLGGRKSININGLEIASLSQLTAQQLETIGTTLSIGYIGFAMPIVVVVGFCIFFFCLNALYDDRKDRSVLFWKSLPLSDSATVLSKVVMAAGIAPAIALVIAVATAALLALLTCLFALLYGGNVFGYFLGESRTYLAPLQLVAMLPIYALWALPAIGWLLMISAWARSKPFLWAVGVPVMTGVLAAWANKIFNYGWDNVWFWKNIIGRLLGGVMPGAWLRATAGDIAHVDRHGLTALDEIVNQSWQLLADSNIWIGVVAGFAMIYVAIRLRGWRDEG